MRLVSWHQVGKGSLIGCATIELPVGLRIIDAPVFTGRNGPWASLPRKPVLDRDGKQRLDVNGKPQFQPLIEWRDRTLSDRFSEAVVALVREQHPDALGDGNAS
jgi:hypothetical protein